MNLPESARALIESGAHAHLVTLNADGSPQVTIVWMGVESGPDGDELVSAHMFESVKVKNMRRDGRVVVSFDSPTLSGMGLGEYLVIYGTARIVEGGAPELLQKLAHVYMGPEVVFPAMENPPAGFINHIKIERVTGVGPWTGRVV